MSPIVGDQSLKRSGTLLTQLEPPTAPVTSPSGAQPKKPIYKRVWFLVLSGLLIIGIFAPKSSGSKSTNPTSTTQIIVTSTAALPTTTLPEPLWTEILNSTSSPLDMSNSLCSELESVMKKQTKIIKDRLNATSKPSKDAFDSADYLKTIDWESFEHRTNVLAEQHAVSDPQLIQAALSNPTEEQLAQFLEDTLSTCSLNDPSVAVLSDASSLDSRLAIMQLHANNLPWYPKGFREFRSSGIAYAALDLGKFSCSFSRCIEYYFVTRTSCPDFYVEVTTYDESGANVGWSNDTAKNVQPGVKVKLHFDLLEDAARSVEVSDISCY